MADIVCFDSTGNIFDHFTQWDINQTVLITGADNTSVPDLHFYNKYSKKAIVVPGTVRDGAIIASVPNLLLQQAEPIIADIVYNSANGSSGTKYTLRLPVRPKPMPDSDEYNDLTITVQKSNYNFKTDSRGYVSVFTVFSPDVVVIHCGSYDNNSVSVRCDLVANFAENPDQTISVTRRVATYSPDGNVLNLPYINAIIKRNSTGFEVERIWYSNTSGQEKTVGEQLFSYVAIKYT